MQSEINNACLHMSLALRHVHVSVDKVVNFQSFDSISACLFSEGGWGGSFNTVSSISVRTRYFFFFLLEAGQT